jgi:hypothetical protein
LKPIVDSQTAAVAEPEPASINENDYFMRDQEDEEEEKN